jgi:hypothetical protein
MPVLDIFVIWIFVDIMIDVRIKIDVNLKQFHLIYFDLLWKSENITKNELNNKQI